MTKLLATAALLFAACGGATRSSPQTATTTSGGTDHAVDPTVPSWTPKSCIAYHKVTIEALDCPAIEQSTRDQIVSRVCATTARSATGSRPNESVR